MEEDVLIDLIAKELTGEILPKEREELQRLISASPQNEVIYSDLKSKWEAAGNLKVAIDPSTDKSWERFQNRRVKTFRLQPTLVRIAALLILGFGIGYYFFGQVGNHETSFATAQESREISLPDGTVVTLNANSRLAYEGDFTGTPRSVSLEGEAFFDVTRNPDRPFVINVSEATVEVLGTSFNVDAYSTSENISVSVSTGRVALRKRNSTEKVILEKGMYGLFNRKTNALNSYASVPGNPDYWRTGYLKYSDMPLREVVADLNNNFKLHIEIDDSKIGGCRFTSSFEHPQLDEVLEILSLTMNLTLEKTGNGYRLSGEGCNQF